MTAIHVNCAILLALSLRPAGTQPLQATGPAGCQLPDAISSVRVEWRQPMPEADAARAFGGAVARRYFVVEVAITSRLGEAYPHDPLEGACLLVRPEWLVAGAEIMTRSVRQRDAAWEPIGRKEPITFPPSDPFGTPQSSCIVRLLAASRPDAGGIGLASTSAAGPLYAVSPEPYDRLRHAIVGLKGPASAIGSAGRRLPILPEIVLIAREKTVSGWVLFPRGSIRNVVQDKEVRIRTIATMDATGMALRAMVAFPCPRSPDNNVTDIVRPAARPDTIVVPARTGSPH